jgi:hypothetical protein
MRDLIKKILKESIDDKIVDRLTSRYGDDFIYSRSGNQKLYELGFSYDEIEKIINIIDDRQLKQYSEKIDEYVEKYHQNPTLAKERFLKDVVINVSNKRIGTLLYNQFLKKLSQYTGEVYSRKYSKPDRSRLLMKIAKYLEDPSDKPKTRGEFLKQLGVPRSHYSTTFTRLYDNGLLRQTIKNGRKVLELGPNFQKFIEGKPHYTGDMYELFDDFIEKYGLNGKKFWEIYKEKFYSSTELSKFWKSFVKYLRGKGLEPNY